MSYLLVFLGGGVGSLLRYLISRLSAKWIPYFPVGTIIANTLGMFLIGLFTVIMIDKNMVTSPFREMYLVGFLGGLTTFSTFGYECFYLFNQGRWLELGLYLSGNFIVGFILLIIGRYLGNL